MLTINDLTVSYGNTPVFEHLNTEFAPGKITGIIGPNGAGKSTLINGLLGLIKVQGGTVRFNDRPISMMRKDIAYVEQRKALDMTFPIDVFSTVLTGTYGRVGVFHAPGKRARAAAAAAIDAVGLTDYRDRQIGSLSGGQLQRVFVARAITQQADLIILDEPFVGIDLASERAIMGILQQWRNDGKTVIVVHHDLNKVSAYFDDLLIMNHGVIASGPVSEVYVAHNIQRAFSADLSNVLFAKEGSAAHD